MKLERVELFNIRQFLGLQVIELSTTASRKVTLLHGPNTVGKTTLLNAIYWCFNGTTLPGFDDPDRLHSAESNDIRFWVEVAFEHSKRKFIARRAGKGAGKSALSEAKLTVLEVKDNGNSDPHPQPELLIASILPEGLAKFFFFAGEMIEKGLSSGAYQKGATDAIRAVLGLKLAEQAIEDLRELKKKKRRELTNLSAGTDLSEITNSLGDAESYVESRVSQLSSLRELVAQLETQKRQLFDELRGIESSSELQRRRDHNIGQLKQAKLAVGNALAARQDFVAESGSAIFLDKLASEVSQFIDTAVTTRRIPSPYDKTFVQDILSSHKCVCDRPIELGSAAYRAVASLINTATDEATIQRALTVRGVAERVKVVAKGANRSLRRVLDQYSVALQRLEQLEQEEARINDLMKRHQERNVRALEQQLEGVESQLRELTVNKQRTEDEVATKRQEIERLKKEFDRASAASPQVDQARDVLELMDYLIADLERELQSVETEGLQRISAALNNVVENSTRQKYSAEVTPDYQIELYTAENGQEKYKVRVLSSGEKRLLDLCFVSALVSVCRERENEGNAILLPGAVAPMIVDAPFGELDPEYQALAATTMLALSEQLILMLSKTHCTPAVYEAIKPAIGKEYLLVGYRSGDAREAAAVEIEIDNKIYQQMVYGQDKNWTEMQEIGA